MLVSERTPATQPADPKNTWIKGTADMLTQILLAPLLLIYTLATYIVGFLLGLRFLSPLGL